MSNFLPRSNSNRSDDNQPQNTISTGGMIRQRSTDSSNPQNQQSSSSSSMSRENSNGSTLMSKTKQQQQILHHRPLSDDNNENRQKSNSSSYQSSSSTPQRKNSNSTKSKSKSKSYHDQNDSSSSSSTSSSSDDDDDSSSNGGYRYSSMFSYSSSNTRRTTNTIDPKDPYRIYSRFVRQSKMHFREALSEIQAGRKSSCWSWYFWPVSPWIVNGVERGSYMNQEYCLRDLPPNDKVGFDACRAYLRFPTTEGVNLRSNYLAIIAAVGDQLEKGIRPVSLAGCLDEPKLRSSLKLFEKVSRGGFDDEVHQVVSRALKLMKEEPME